MLEWSTSEVVEFIQQSPELEAKLIQKISESIDAVPVSTIAEAIQENLVDGIREGISDMQFGDLLSEALMPKIIEILRSI